MRSILRGTKISWKAKPNARQLELGHITRVLRDLNSVSNKQKRPVATSALEPLTRLDAMAGAVPALAWRRWSRRARARGRRLAPLGDLAPRRSRGDQWKALASLGAMAGARRARGAPGGLDPLRRIQ